MAHEEAGTTTINVTFRGGGGVGCVGGAKIWCNNNNSSNNNDNNNVLAVHDHTYCILMHSSLEFFWLHCLLMREGKGGREKSSPWFYSAGAKANTPPPRNILGVPPLRKGVNILPNCFDLNWQSHMFVQSDKITFYVIVFPVTLLLWADTLYTCSILLDKPLTTITPPSQK